MSDADLYEKLLEARFDSLEAKLASMLSMLQKENDRQDVAIERLADRTPHINEYRRLEKRVEKLEGKADSDQQSRNKTEYRVKVTWAIVTFAGALFLIVLAALIKGWIGV